MDPVNMREIRAFSGKYGSFTPVTGFSSIAGAIAANSGRGGSCPISHHFWSAHQPFIQTYNILNLEITSNLIFMEIHAVPVVSESGILAFPVFQKRDSP